MKNTKKKITKKKKTNEQFFVEEHLTHFLICSFKFSRTTRESKLHLFSFLIF